MEIERLKPLAADLKNPGPGKSERRIEISGNPENIEEAKNRIKAICDEVGRAALKFFGFAIAFSSSKFAR